MARDKLIKMEINYFSVFLPQDIANAASGDSAFTVHGLAGDDHRGDATVSICAWTRKCYLLSCLFRKSENFSSLNLQNKKSVCPWSKDSFLFIIICTQGDLWIDSTFLLWFILTVGFVEWGPVVVFGFLGSSNHLLGNVHLLDGSARNLEHGLQENALLEKENQKKLDKVYPDSVAYKYCTKSSSASLSFHCHFGNLLQCILIEWQLDTVHGEELLVLWH